MKKPISGWNKFHLINAAHNAADQPPEKGLDDRRRTGQEIITWAKTLWSRPDSGVTEQDVEDMMEHLLKTKQIMFVTPGFNYDDVKASGSKYLDLFVKLGEVVFEPDIEGHKISLAAERAARLILENLDDRHNSPTGGWPQDVRNETVNTWAAIIDATRAEA